MKTQIFSRRNAPISIIGFLLLVSTTQIGCGVLFNVNRVMRLDANRVMKLDPILLTQDDLSTMRLTSSWRGPGVGGIPEGSSVIVGCKQSWDGGLRSVRYWLFDSASSAKSARATGVFHVVAAPMNFQPELNPDDVIGDATWRHIPTRRKAVRSTFLVFVRNNVLVHVITDGPWSSQLQLARDVARKIEAKIAAVLEKK